jgi:hypothetical protein
VAEDVDVAGAAGGDHGGVEGVDAEAGLELAAEEDGAEDDEQDGVSPPGRVGVGGRTVNRSAFAIHARIHVARPDLDAAVHSHSRHGKAWSALGRLIDESARRAYAEQGTPIAGWFTAQPLFEGVLADEPDLLD